jgi:hypothetical protein
MKSTKENIGEIAVEIISVSKAYREMKYQKAKASAAWRNGV